MMDTPSDGPFSLLKDSIVADVSVDFLKSILKYDAETGVFAYVKSRGRHQVGDAAGFISSKSTHNGGGYRIIAIREGEARKEYAAHRLAWFFVFGVWPKNQLDHINMKRDDNRIVNLREATRSQNCANKNAQSNNSSGFKGVSFHKRSQRWRADLHVDGEPLFLGLHDSASSAVSAYELAAYLYFGEFSRVTGDLLHLGD